MINKETIRKIFNEVSKNQIFAEGKANLPSVRLHIKTGEAEPHADLSTREITVFLNDYSTEDDYRYLIYHELLHLYFLPRLPIILNNTITMLMSHLNMVSSEENSKYISKMTNAIFDMFIDKRLIEMDVFNNQRWQRESKCLLKFLSENKLSFDDLFLHGYFQGCYASYLTALTENNILQLKKPYLEIGEKALNTINSKNNIVEKIKDIAFLLNQDEFIKY